MFSETSEHRQSLRCSEPLHAHYVTPPSDDWEVPNTRATTFHNWVTPGTGLRTAPRERDTDLAHAPLDDNTGT